MFTVVNTLLSSLAVTPEIIRGSWPPIPVWVVSGRRWMTSSSKLMGWTPVGVFWSIAIFDLSLAVVLVTCPQERDERRVQRTPRRDDLGVLSPGHVAARLTNQQSACRGVPRRARDLEVGVEPAGRDPREVERRGSGPAD